MSPKVIQLVYPNYRWAQDEMQFEVARLFTKGYWNVTLNKNRSGILICPPWDINPIFILRYDIDDPQKFRGREIASFYYYPDTSYSTYECLYLMRRQTLTPSELHRLHNVFPQDVFDVLQFFAIVQDE